MHLPVILILTFAIFSCRGNQPTIDKTTVTELDLNRYAGTWYEIARFPHRFEKDLTAVTATYKVLDNGKIEVTNTGFKGTPDGPRKQVVGKAKQPDPEKPGQLKVSFFLFFYADYNVLELDSAYQWVVVGSKTADYLWILSRTPEIPDSLFRQLTVKAQKRGYKIDKLIKVPQK